MAPELSRRSLLQGAGLMGLLWLLPSERVSWLVESAAAQGQAGRFLSAHELDTLRALTGRLIPGPPEDPDPGAVEARCAEAIDLLLGAFEVDPPLIHAGGPFSDRSGAHHDDFADFVRLDAHATLGWRIRLEGSKGLAEREFAGPVIGLQQVYREGLAHLDQRSRDGLGIDFKDTPSPAQDLLLSDTSDDALQSFVATAFTHTQDAMYGPPEYGGNHGLVGWSFTRWAGDRQPAGYSDGEVRGPGGGAPLTSSQARTARVHLPALARRSRRKSR